MMLPGEAAVHSSCTPVPLFSQDQHSLKSNNTAIKPKSNISTIRVFTGLRTS